MRILPFKSSAIASVGVELEIQLIDPITFDMVSRAKDLIRNIRERSYQKRIKPEITQSMIEINSSIHQSPKALYEEFVDMRGFLLEQAKAIKVNFSGGGTHPFQRWALRKIFPSKRFRNKAKLYRYLSKRSTVFGQHVHIGCGSGEDALYLTHALARYVPQLIALSASSPFYQSIDTGFNSSRSNVFNAFPMSGIIPYFETWEEFSNYFYKMRELGVIETMKDVYWDIRPKPEFGTVEVRVCDTPLTLKKAVNIAAYIQTLSHYLLQERKNVLSQDLYFLYGHNRFQACRYGFDGEFIHPFTFKHYTIADDILNTAKKIERSGHYLNNMPFISQLINDVISRENDAAQLRELFKEVKTLPNLVREQCIIWANE